MAASVRDWADLPYDLLNLILSKMPATDRQSFSHVCKSWNSAAATSPYGPSPCLMYYHRTTYTWRFFHHNSFFNVTIPELEHAEIRCARHGWLLVSLPDNSTLFFFNPLGGGVGRRWIDLPLSPGHFTAVGFVRPPTSPECVVVGISIVSAKDSPVRVSLLRRGEMEWAVKDYPNVNAGKGRFLASQVAPVAHGRICFLGVESDVGIFCPESGQWVVRAGCLGRRRGHWAQTKIKDQFLLRIDGGLVGVFVFHDEGRVRVFRLSEEEERRRVRWVPVEDVGDRVLYLSHASSFYCLGRNGNNNRVYLPRLAGDASAAVFYSLTTRKYHSVDDGGGCSWGDAYGLMRLDLAAWVTPDPLAPGARRALPACRVGSSRDLKKES